MSTFKILIKTTAAIAVHTTGTIKGGLDELAISIEAKEEGYIYDRQNKSIKESFTQGKSLGSVSTRTAIDYTVDTVTDLFTDDKPKPTKKTSGYGSFGKK